MDILGEVSSYLRGIPDAEHLDSTEAVDIRHKWVMVSMTAGRELYECAKCAKTASTRMGGFFALASLPEVCGTE